ncbi:NADPH dehydrogenase NamA [Taibaiella sp. KBW10]|uniref:NADPH dehydrogenase NamA n=1 Tax=Taibaiella sp. KBW10 TaxID=2153357 RepID=UPI000F59714D|nr:NADPH dehydrogenase NamA [Taibaiella sp. KBW10]RQO31619.1 NADPH dehydrogenase NamA [Taibaiella sp. KBW10]
MSLLFSPLTIKSITLKNRVAMSPMCMYSAVEGLPNDWHYIHYTSRAIGGVGLIIQEATAVTPEGRISYADLGIWSDAHTEKYKAIVSTIRKYDCVPGIQLAHAGRKASCEVSWNKGWQIPEGPDSWQTVAPSPLPFHERDMIPHELTVAEIKEIVSAFRQAAQRALDAGYQLIEIHAAHGYLINEFYSPLSNQRTDAYGGSFDNRIRFLLEVIDAVNEVWPETLPLFVRISATDWMGTEGWDTEDSVALARILKTKGVDLVDCSTAANTRHATIPVGPDYQVPFADAVRNQAGIMSGAVGLITTAEQAEAILQEQKADLIFMGRALLRDPYFALHAATALGAEVSWHKQYERAKG